MRLNRNGLAQSGVAVADVTAREVPHAAGDVAGVQIALDGTAGDNSTPCTVAADWRCDGVRPQRTTDHRQVQRLHDGGRAADRLGLLRPGPRRADHQGQERRVELRRRRQLLRLDHRLAPARTSTTSTSSGPTARRRWRRWATSASSTTPRSTPAWTPAPPTSGRTSRTACTSTSSTRQTDAKGILHYKVAVKSLDGAGPQTRGVALHSAGAAAGRAPASGRPARSR